MSTKCTITHGPSYHFYEECFDEDSVYIELENPKQAEFTTTNYGTTTVVSIPLDIMDEICAAWLKKTTNAVDESFINATKKLGWNNNKE